MGDFSHAEVVKRAENRVDLRRDFKPSFKRSEKLVFEKIFIFSEAFFCTCVNLSLFSVFPLLSAIEMIYMYSNFAFFDIDKFFSKIERWFFSLAFFVFLVVSSLKNKSFEKQLSLQCGFSQF